MRVDGEAGEDTLRMDGGGLTLDLRLVPDTRIRDVEIIDLTGSGDNTLFLQRGDVLAMSSNGTLRIDGDAGDTLTVADAAGWTKTPDAGGYFSYTNGGATLVVDMDVTHNLS